MSSPSNPNRNLLFDFERGRLGDASGPAAAVELPKKRVRDLHSIGHKVERFLAARGQWWKQARKPEFEALPSWARGLDAPPVGCLAGEGVFACGLVLTGESIRMPHVILSHSRTGRFWELWRSIDHEAPAAPAAILSVPSDANDPLWLALLRLRPLREFWDRELRRATVDALLGMLPDAWMLDPARVPEGAVIPRLELPAWSELRHYRTTGRTFSITGMQTGGQEVILDAESPPEAWDEATAEALAAFHHQPRVLVDRSAIVEEGSLPVVAFYQKSGARVEMLGTMVLTTTADGCLVPARVTTA